MKNSLPFNIECVHICLNGSQENQFNWKIQIIKTQKYFIIFFTNSLRYH